ncbi:MAG: IS91 family transposase [Segetibacter sp.]|nr:IS91 family transposase [Segetibacter sp.]
MLSYRAPRATVQQVLQKHPLPFNKNVHVAKVLQRIKTCRTAALGYHVYGCTKDDCGHIKYQYHSCRDRHCPNCGAVKKQEWIEARTQELLPVKYYHVVFTLPHELNSLVMGHRRLLYKLLFDASAATLLTFAKDEEYMGAVPGIISVLHTWGQQLSFHPHIHSIVSGGGIQNNNTWKEATNDDRHFLFPVKAMGKVYRAKFLQALQQMFAKEEVKCKEDSKQLMDLLYRKDWVVYAKAPLGGPQAVIEYLGRYTHKVAISNHRIGSIDDENGTVSYGYKDYADGDKPKQMTLTVQEFMRRFEQHILPERFTKIRTYGYLANRNRHRRINEVLRKMKLPLHKGLVKIPIQVRMLEQFGIDMKECPACKNKTLQLIKIFYPWKNADDG